MTELGIQPIVLHKDVPLDNEYACDNVEQNSVYKLTTYLFCTVQLRPNFPIDQEKEHSEIVENLALFLWIALTLKSNLTANAYDFVREEYVFMCLDLKPLGRHFSYQTRVSLSRVSRESAPRAEGWIKLTQSY